MESTPTNVDDQPPQDTVRQLAKPQRRALGVLIEKGFTTPEYYPLTLKAALSGCNQKSNRAPVTNYSEDALWQTLDELRELGLVAVVLPASGRTERYRHLIRKRFTFTEPQLAILTELWLRGRQQLGELRSRASRMVPIESQSDLKDELSGLLEMGFIWSSGPLDRRGIEIDHTFYLDSEKVSLTAAPPASPESETAPPVSSTPVAPAENHESRRELEALRTDYLELKGNVEELRQTLEEVKDDLSELRRSLGA